MTDMTDKQRLKHLEQALDSLEKTRQGWVQAKKDLSKAGHWKAAMQHLHALQEDLKPGPKPPPQVPQLGPACAGDKSVLMFSPTHATSGLPLYPAYDSGWRKGMKVIAPESMKVTRHSGGSGSGYSLYATGVSGLKYYFQHMESAGRAALGSRVPKGGKIGVLGDFVGARVPHLHLGINAEAILGSGKQFKYGKTGRGPDYTLGSPTIGVQLAQV